MEYCDWVLPIFVFLVAIFMCKRFPTGVGGDPFPYELVETAEARAPHQEE